MVMTSTIRSWWNPPCQPSTVDLTPAYRALDACLKVHNYKPRAADTGAYNCRKITGGTGYSLHAYAPGARFVFWSGARVTMALAVDVNWQSNPYGPRLVTDMPREMVAAIKAIRTVTGRQVWRWGGDYSGNKDAMHFEIVCHPSDLATGIDPSTLPAAKAAPSPAPTGGFLMALTDAQQQEVYDAVTRLTPILVRKAGTTYEDTVCLLFRATGQMVSLDKGSWEASKPAIDFFKANLGLDRVISLSAVQYNTYRIVG